MKKLAILTGMRHVGKSSICSSLSRLGLCSIDFDEYYNMCRDKCKNNTGIDEDDLFFNFMYSFLYEHFFIKEIGMMLVNATMLGDDVRLQRAIFKFCSDYKVELRLFSLSISQSDREANYNLIKKRFVDQIDLHDLYEISNFSPRNQDKFEIIYDSFPLLDFFCLDGDNIEHSDHIFYQSFDFPFFIKKGLTDSPLKWRKISDYFPAQLKGARVLDIGSNEGYFSLKMAHRNAEVTSIEYNKSISNISHSIIEKSTMFEYDFNINIINEKSHYIQNFDDSYFDYSICLSLLHHVPLFETIRELSRVTKIKSVFEILVDYSLNIESPYCIVADNDVCREVIPSILAVKKIASKFYSEVIVQGEGESRVIFICNK